MLITSSDEDLSSNIN